MADNTKDGPDDNWEAVSAGRDAAWFDPNWAYEDTGKYKDERVVEGLLVGYFTITPRGREPIKYYQVRLNVPYKGLVKPDDSDKFVLVDLAPGQSINLTERKDLEALKSVAGSGTPYLVRIKVSGQRAVKGRAQPMWLFDVKKKPAPKVDVPF